MPAGSWYAGPVAWAADIGVTHGVGGTKFGPNVPITREQMAVMISNYLQAKGVTLPPTAQIPASFADGDQIHSWARAAVQTMSNAGIIGGMPGNLAAPQHLATRAECAAIFQRLIYAFLANNLAEAGDQA